MVMVLIMPNAFVKSFHSHNIIPNVIRNARAVVAPIDQIGTLHHTNHKPVVMELIGLQSIDICLSIGHLANKVIERAAATTGTELPPQGAQSDIYW